MSFVVIFGNAGDQVDKCENALPVSHLPSLQISKSFAIPTHAFPPFCGCGSLHLRVLDLEPFPHVVEQEDQAVHRLQWPSIGAEIKYIHLEGSID